MEVYVSRNLSFTQIEVFNLLFVTTQEKAEVRCFACARRMDPSLRSFSVLFEYYMQELAVIYDNFQFHGVSPTVFALFFFTSKSFDELNRNSVG